MKIIQGIWASNANIGNIIGLEFGSIFIDHMKAGWQYCYLSAGIFCFIMAFVTLLLLKPYPEDYGFEHKKDQDIVDELQMTENAEAGDEAPQGITIGQAMRIPGMLHYTLAYTFCKATNYGILFWLPTYLKEKGLGDVRHYLIIVCLFNFAIM